MQLISWIRRFFASSPRKHDLWGHPIYAPKDGGSASHALRLLEHFPDSAPKLLGHLIVADLQLWKEAKDPQYEFIIARVVQVEEADSLPPYAKGSELASTSIRIDRNELWKPRRRRSAPLSPRVPSESATSASQHGSADSLPILNSHDHSESAPELSSSAHTQEFPPVSTDNADPELADDDSVTTDPTTSLRIPRQPYDEFKMYPDRSIRSITWGSVCMARMDFTTASRPLLFEELAMMATVTSDSVTEYLTPRTRVYWHAALVWGMAILHTGAKPEGVNILLRLLIGASNSLSPPARVFGVDDQLKPAELLETFSHKWHQFKDGLIRQGKMREEAILREVYEARAEARHDLELANKQAQEARNEAAEAGNRATAARKLVEEQANRIAELERMLAQRDGTTSA